jgi:hypothetical protein
VHSNKTPPRSRKKAIISDNIFPKYINLQSFSHPSAAYHMS